ncbi:YolD-like family protein [Lederbergia lenta]|uniref:YolD-like protein n=1 Tax=Lederbergia lenta TaxID=1467 RepID=A0A2X4WLW7_LEDLE|nr:YolD-like family protein [Lederbergia lenta]MEC2324055.1 YolD-like family protein [Lederbergia lenta]SQI60728.1 YolD-like protein [Lederbergia lenta]
MKIKKLPENDEQQWQEFAQIISDAQINNQKLKITIWKDGFFEDVIGWLNNVNMQLKRSRLDIDEFDVEYVGFDDITNIAIVD